MPLETMSIEEFVKLKYPVPNEDDPDYQFYKSWDYEEYLIKIGSPTDGGRRRVCKYAKESTASSCRHGSAIPPPMHKVTR